MSYLYLVLAFVLNATANILLKSGASKGVYTEVFPLGVFFRNNMYLFLGFLFFVLNALFYFFALKNIPLSLGYPVMVTMSLLLIGTYAFVFGGELFTYYHLIGYALIILGVAVTFLHTR